MKRKSGSLVLKIGFIIIVIIIVGIIVVVMMQPKTRKYKLQDPKSLTERKTLIDNLKEDLEGIIRIDESDDTHSFKNDPDYFFPMDRTLIVIAIQEYYLSKVSYPRSMNDLFDGGFINKNDLSLEYILKSNSEGWKVYRDKYKIAEGN